MKIVKGHYGKCRFCDCLDLDYGIPSLEPNRWDICFTDTVWGHDYDGTKPFGLNKKATHHQAHPYDDTWKPDFHLRWMNAIQQKTEAQIICAGRKHYDWWVVNFLETHKWDINIIYDNGQGSTETSRHGARMPYMLSLIHI